MSNNKKVTILDYGLGNLMSVSRAIKKVGALPKVSDKFEDIRRADYLVLPGVGNFSVAIKELENRGFIEEIKKYAELERPLMGICLGMQLLFESSEEQGYHEGLGLIEGKVEAIPKKNSSNIPNKIPHIGWARISILERDKFNEVNFFDKSDNKFFYFVHSFQGIPKNDNNYLATTKYNDIQITAAVRNGYIVGCQFHPEKSGDNGIALIDDFLEM